ncbi:MAG: hypothetical protein VW239_01500 [Candidatus Nanopelagicales bacterium]|jgi:high-affinity nickel-transport protein
MMQRPQVVRVVGAVVGLNIVAWGVFAAFLLSGSSGATFAGAGVLCFVLGMRHAFDADHLAAIDDTTRLLVGRGKAPVSLGLGFATGHSLVVFLLFIVVAVATSRIGDSSFAEIGGRIAMTVAAAFLLTIGILNARLVRRLLRERSKDPGADVPVAPAGVMSSAFGARFRGRIQSGWQMVPVGFVFGLGMETASEVALLGLSATASGQGVPWWALLALPLLFAAGMALFDTLDSLMMTHLYTSEGATARVRLNFNIAVTGLTASIALVVGAVYLSELLTSEFGVGLLAPIAELANHFEWMGYVIVAVYVALWLVLLNRSRSARQSSAMTSAHSSPSNIP